METTVIIPGIIKSQVAAELFHDLCAIYPDGQRANAFGMELPENDPRATGVLGRLAEAGLKPSVGFGRPKADEFRLDLERTYDAEDLQAAAYLQFGAAMWESVRGTQGLLHLKVTSLNSDEAVADDGIPFDPQFGVGSASLAQVVVATRIKRLIEAAAALNSMKFRPAVLTQDDYLTPVPWNVVGEPWWELTSDRIMPPLSSSCSLITGAGGPFDGDFAKGCLLQEGRYRSPELHYRASELATLGDVDLALTAEQFGVRPTADCRRLIASNRFYRFCTENDIRFEWTPIRVDPG